MSSQGSTFPISVSFHSDPSCRVFVVAYELEISFRFTEFGDITQQKLPEPVVTPKSLATSWGNVFF